MITITLNGDFTLTADSNIIPCQYSGNIPFQFDISDEYSKSIVSPGYVYWDGDKKIEGPITDYVNGLFTLPALAFKKESMLGIAFSIMKDEKTITTEPCEFEVRESINLGIEIDKNDAWQQMLANFVDQYMVLVHNAVLVNLQEQAHILQEQAVDQQVLANKALQDLETYITEVNEMVDNGDFTPEFTIGTIEKGDSAKVSLSGTKKNPIFDMTLPKGDPNVLKIGTVQKGDEAKVTITGESPSQTVNFVLPKGDSNILNIGTVKKGEEASATITGNSPNQVLNLTLPKGDKGDKGEKGETGLTGSKGEKGDTGIQGIQGLKGDTGPQGIQGFQGMKGEQGPKGDGILVTHIVTELPASGGTSDIYFLVDGEGYITYMWAENKWVVVGSGDVDLSNYYTKVESDGKYLKIVDGKIAEDIILRKQNMLASVDDDGVKKKLITINYPGDVDIGDSSLNTRINGKEVVFKTDKIPVWNNLDGSRIGQFLTDLGGIVKGNFVNKANYQLDFEGKTSGIEPYVYNGLGIETYGTGNATTVVGNHRFPTVIRTQEGVSIMVADKASNLNENEFKYLVQSDDAIKIKKITFDQYNALSSVDPNTLYIFI